MCVCVYKQASMAYKWVTEYITNNKISVPFKFKPVTRVTAEDNNICTKSHCTSLETISIWKATSKPINTKENNKNKL